MCAKTMTLGSALMHIHISMMGKVKIVRKLAYLHIG